MTESQLVKELRQYGFHPHHTGGGCMCLRRDFSDGSYMMITAEDDPSIPELGDDMMVGLYTNEDDEGSNFIITDSITDINCFVQAHIEEIYS